MLTRTARKILNTNHPMCLQSGRSFKIFHINHLFCKYICFVNVHTLSLQEPQLTNWTDSNTASSAACKAPQISGFSVQLPLFFLPETVMELFCKDHAQNKESSVPGTLSHHIKPGRNICISSLGISNDHQLHASHGMQQTHSEY